MEKPVSRAGGCRKSRARSVDVSSSAQAPSMGMSQSRIDIGSAIIRAFKGAELWSQSKLDAVMPKLLEAKKENDARAQAAAAPESA